jgi:hypothetical protein
MKRSDEQRDKPDNFACYGTSGDSPLGMFTFYVLLETVALGSSRW